MQKPARPGNGSAKRPPVEYARTDDIRSRRKEAIEKIVRRRRRRGA